MDISIIIPAYNCEKTIGRCIESIINQVCDNIKEIVVVNDGSEDNTIDILNFYEKIDERIKVIDKTNGGVSSARNVGIEEAKCSYIMFVDSDDELKCDFVASLICDSNSEDLCIGGIELHRESGNSTISQSGLYSALEVFQCYGTKIQTLLLNGPCAKIFRRHIISSHKIKFDTSVSLGEDTLFVFEYITYCQSILFVDAPGYIYYQLGNSSLMTKFNAKNYFAAKYVYQHIVEFTSEMNNGVLGENIRKIYANVLMHYIRNAIANRKQCPKKHIKNLISDYVSNPIVRIYTENEKGSNIVQRLVHFFVNRKMINSLDLLLTLHIKIRGQ